MDRQTMGHSTHCAIKESGSKNTEVKSAIYIHTTALAVIILQKKCIPHSNTGSYPRYSLNKRIKTAY